MIVLITGPSGAGKSSFIAELMAGRSAAGLFGVHHHAPHRARARSTAATTTSWTTRPSTSCWPRTPSWSGPRCTATATARAAAGLDEMTAAGKIPVLDIDVQGGVQVLDQFGPELVSVFLFPPSWDELEQAPALAGHRRPR